MRTIELEMSTADSAERIAHLVWRAGHVEVRFVADELRPAVDRWIAQGVREWVERDGGQRAARITPSTDAMFLRRLAADLRRQFNFSVDLETRDEPAPPVGVRRTTAEPVTLARDSQGRLAKASRAQVRLPASTLELEWHS